MKKYRNSILELVLIGIFTALTYVFTAFINIRLPFAPNGGLIHLGNVPLFIGAILFGWRLGMIAGGIGMALFDLTSGWTMWAPFTLIIVGLMGFSVGMIARKKTPIRYIFALAVAWIIKIAGYYLAEGILYGNFVIPATSIPGNCVQIGVAAVIVLIIIEPLRLATRKIFPQYTSASTRPQN